MAYPKPSIPYFGDSVLYFATERQVHSSASLGNYDRGEISVSPGRVTFRGMNVLVECPNVLQIRLVRKAFPWLIFLPVVVVAALIVYANSPIPFTWRQPLPFIIGAILLFAAILYAREKWVEVLFQDGEISQRAYFRESPAMFWLAAGRNRRLVQELQCALVAQSQEDSAEPSVAHGAGRRT